MQHISVPKFSRWLTNFFSLFFYSKYTLWSYQEHIFCWVVQQIAKIIGKLQKGGRATQKREEQIWYFLYISCHLSLRSLYYATEWGVAVGMGSRIQRAPNTHNCLERQELKMQFVPWVQLVCMRVINPPAVRALKAGSGLTAAAEDIYTGGSAGGQ